tara:strand:- start:1362 stop:1721 length:360 start_codon:yes stop_codon:yes gene_type:complete
MKKLSNLYNSIKRSNPTNTLRKVNLFSAFPFNNTIPVNQDSKFSPPKVDYGDNKGPDSSGVDFGKFDGGKGKGKGDKVSPITPGGTKQVHTKAASATSAATSAAAVSSVSSVQSTGGKK